MKIKTKYLNHLTLQGKKETSEKQLLKSFKAMQKISNKNSEKIFQLALIFSIPIFKLHKLKINKKKKTFREIPGFIKNKHSRTSFASKLIILNIKKNVNNTLSKKFINEILSTSKKKKFYYFCKK